MPRVDYRADTTITEEKLLELASSITALRERIVRDAVARDALTRPPRPAPKAPLIRLGPTASWAILGVWTFILVASISLVVVSLVTSDGTATFAKIAVAGGCVGALAAGCVGALRREVSTSDRRRSPR